MVLQSDRFVKQHPKISDGKLGGGIQKHKELHDYGSLRYLRLMNGTTKLYVVCIEVIGQIFNAYKPPKGEQIYHE